MRKGAVAVVVLVALGAACRPARPRERCADRAPAPLRFRDATEEWGLTALGVVGNRLSAADLDGDGLPELHVSAGSGSGERDDFADATAPRRRFLLRNTGSGFEDATRASGFAAVRTGADGSADSGRGRAYSYALFADLDGDGDVDGVTITERWDVAEATPDTGDRSEVLLNRGDGTFALVDLAQDRSALSERWDRSTAATLLDADRDGVVDVFVGNQYGVFGVHSTAEQDRLFLGRGDGRFSDRTEEAGLERAPGGGRSAANASEYTEDDGAHVHWATFGVTACDVDRDGDTDLVTQTYGRGLNQLWLNAGDGTFANATAGSGWSRDEGDDYGTDERFRCYCANEGAGAPDCAGVPGPRIGCNPGEWLPGWDDQPHRLGGNTFSAACADLDGDGDNDLATGEIRHWWTPGASDASTIAWNDGGSPPRFTRRERAAVGLEQEHDSDDWNEGDLTVGAFDLDQDGVVDLLRPQSDYADTRLHLYRGLGGGSFEEVARDASIDFPRAAGHAVVDVDGDGDLDVVTSFSRMRCDEECAYATPEVHLFLNEGGAAASGLTIDLVGRGPGGTNVSGIGAEVRVVADGVTQVREVAAGIGHQGVQHGLAAYFGLGEACRAQRVEVRWTDGAVETWPGIPANWRVTLVEGDDEPHFAGWEP